jgi:hypothetical protein
VWRSRSAQVTDGRTDGRTGRGPTRDRARGRAGARTGAGAVPPRWARRGRGQGRAVARRSRGGTPLAPAIVKILGAPLRNGGVRGTQIPRDRLRLCYSFRVAPPEGGALAVGPFDGYAVGGGICPHGHTVSVRPGDATACRCPAGSCAWAGAWAGGGVCRGCPLRSDARRTAPVNSYPSSSSHRRLSTDD